MAVQNKIGPYYSNTYEFVDELRNYLKIAKICRVRDEPSNLPPVTDCFGENYQFVKVNSNGDSVNLSDIKTGSSLGMKAQDNNNNWTSDNIAITTPDGAHIILSYNTNCAEKTENDGLSCIAGIVDINGDNKPNIFGDDVY